MSREEIAKRDRVSMFEWRRMMEQVGKKRRRLKNRPSGELISTVLTFVWAITGI